MYIPKRKRLKSEALRLAGHGKRCVLCKAGISMPCHLPHNAYGFPAGTGQKTHDWLQGDCCNLCHYKLDEGEWRNDIEMRMKAFALTIQRRIDEGVIVIVGENHVAPEFSIDSII